MNGKLSRALDDCLDRVNRREAVGACLNQYPQLRAELASLIQIALSISALPKVMPRAQYRQLSKARLMARLLADQASKKQRWSLRTGVRTEGLSATWQRPSWAQTRAWKIAVPVAVTATLAALFLSGVLSLWSSSPALAAKCTLATADGEVRIQAPNSDIWTEGIAGQTLETGTKITTTSASQALLTFFEGSTIELGEDARLELVELVRNEETTNIVLRHWLGRTRSNVEEVPELGSHYEIQTPSAYARVQGTVFVTEVNDAGSTLVQTIEGLVVVGGQNQEVNVAAGYETYVEPGGTPLQPQPIRPASEAYHDDRAGEANIDEEIEEADAESDSDTDVLIGTDSDNDASSDHDADDDPDIENTNDDADADADDDTDPGPDDDDDTDADSDGDDDTGANPDDDDDDVDADTEVD